MITIKSLDIGLVDDLRTDEERALATVSACTRYRTTNTGLTLTMMMMIDDP